MKQQVVTWFAAGLLGLGGLMIGSGVAQADVAQGAGRVTAQRVLRSTATVQNVDTSARSVELLDKDGDTVTVQVPDSVKGLDKLNKGDQIDVTYKQALAIKLQAPGEAPIASESTTAQQEGGQVNVARKVVGSAEIVRVNADKGRLRLKGPDGKIHKITVDDPAMRKKLSQLKVGQHISITYTEAVATSLVPTAK
jgi:hypothetical protein